MDMLHFQMYVVVSAVDIEKAIGNFFKYGLIILALMAGLFIFGKIYKFISHLSAEIKMEKHGVRKVEITDVNIVTKDDSLERAGFGYMVAGDRGWLLGAMMGQKYDELKSVSFRIFYKNNTEQKVICVPKDRLFDVLIKIADD